MSLSLDARFSICVDIELIKSWPCLADAHDIGANLTVAEKPRGFPRVDVVTMNNPKRFSDPVHRLQLAEFRATIVEGSCANFCRLVVCVCGEGTCRFVGCLSYVKACLSIFGANLSSDQ